MRRKRKKTVEVSIIYDRKHTATKSTARNRKAAPVSVSVYYDRKKVLFPTGVRVYTDQFKNGRVYNHGQQGLYNERIYLVQSAIEDYINNVYKKGCTFSIDGLKEFMSDSNVGEENSFLDFMEKSIEGRNISESTRDKHRNIFRRLKDWGRIRSFRDITLDKIIAWHSEAIKAASKAPFTVNYDRVLRIYIRLAYSKGLIKENPYVKWKVPKYTPAQTHRSISLSDLEKIEDVPLDKKFRIMSRDLFVFQANTGMSYIDTQKFDKDELTRNRGRIAYQNKRVKTAERFYIPLNEKAKSVLNKYGGTPPKIGLEAYNVNLKAIARKAGVTLPISSHWARHTFAMICLNHGMSIEVLAAILGHSDIKTTQIYAVLRQDTVDDAFYKVMRDIDKKEDDR